QCPGYAEACVARIIEVAARGVGAGSGGGTHERRHVGPGAAAEHPPAAIARGPCAAVPGRADIALVPAILGPLPDVAEHVVEAEWTRLDAAGIGDLLAVPAAPAAVAVGIALADRLAPPAGAGGTGARCVFPLGFAGQVIGAAAGGRGERCPCAHLAVEPGDIGACVVPAQAHRGPAGRRDVSRWIGEAATRRLPGEAKDRIAGRGSITGLPEKDQEFLVGDVVFAERESTNAHDMLGSFRVESPGLCGRAPHGETPGGNPDHRRALRALAEFPLGSVLCECRPGESDCEKRQERAEEWSMHAPGCAGWHGGWQVARALLCAPFSGYPP